MSAVPAIFTEHLCKRFGEKIAVEDLSLTVAQGEVFGFLGPNGAGKTTTVKMLLGLVSPSAGKIELMGLPVGNPQARQFVGFLPEHFRFHEWLTAREFLAFHAALYGMKRAAAASRIPFLLEQVGLAEHGQKPLRTFSKGMLQRVGLAQALLNEPKLVILDEPTSGLDPVGRRMVRDVIHELRQRGAAVFLNSHLLSEVEIICDRVVFIKRGRVIQERIMAEMAASELRVAVRARNWTAQTIEKLGKWCAEVVVGEEKLSLTVRMEEDLPAIHRYLVESGVDVFAFVPITRSLEEQFVTIIGEDGGL